MNLYEMTCKILGDTIIVGTCGKSVFENERSYLYDNIQGVNERGNDCDVKEIVKYCEEYMQRNEL